MITNNDDNQKKVENYNALKKNERLKPVTVGKVKKLTDEDNAAIKMIDDFIAGKKQKINE